MACKRLTQQEFANLPPDAEGYANESDCPCKDYCWCCAPQGFCFYCGLDCEDGIGDGRSFDELCAEMNGTRKEAPRAPGTEGPCEL